LATSGITKLRAGRTVSRTFRKHAKKLGFNIKFHWIRASHLDHPARQGRASACRG